MAANLIMTVKNAFDFFIIEDEAMLTVMYMYISIGIFNIIVRILISSAYQIKYSGFLSNSKEVKSKKDIKDTGSKFLNAVVKDYLLIAEKGVSNIYTKAIVVKHMQRLNFFGWSLASMEKLVAGFENSLLAIGVLFALLFMPLQWSVLSVLVFVFTKLFSAIFDYALVKDKLLYETTNYVEREIGRFFPSDLAASVNVFRAEIKSVMEMQTKAIGDAVIKAGSDLSSAVIMSVKETNKNIEKTLENVANRAEMLKEPLMEWKSAIEQSEKLQAESNKYYLSLKEMVDLLRISNDGAELKNEAVHEQLIYLQKNQEMIEKSMQQYEQSLMEITSKIGDTLGSIVDYSLKHAYSQIADSINGDLARLTNTNSELIIRLNELFDEMVRQSKKEANAIMAVKDQMDLHFESITRR